MIERSHRFQGLRSLNFVYQNGQVSRGPQFSVKAALNPRRSSYRSAVVICKKVHKSAVVRNRMRRQLYETMRLLGGGISQPYDIVITVFNDDLLATSAKRRQSQLKKQLKEAGVIGQKSSS